MAEYRAVLLRPKPYQLHGLSVAEIDTLLTDLARHAIVLNPANTVAAPIAPDVGDQFLWDLLTTRPDLVWVTGDKRLLQDPTLLQRSITPQPSWRSGSTERKEASFNSRVRPCGNGGRPLTISAEVTARVEQVWQTLGL